MARVALGGLLAAGLGTAGSSVAATPTIECRALSQVMQGHWPDPTTHIVAATLHEAGPYGEPAVPGSAPSAAPVMLPAHCEVFGILHERIGVDGQAYAIRFHLRLPTAWNERFYFEGGGGSNGVVGAALGRIAGSLPRAIVLGYAVVSQDSGHDNATNSNPARGGAVAFGFDPQARADYGHASLKVVADAAKAIVAAYYGHKAAFSYFVGCSKGGEEGMALAQRYPDEFNGIVAAAPGFSLPHAALAEVWDVQSLAAVADPANAHRLVVSSLARTFSDADLKIVGDAILEACDADDGVKDGIVGALGRCTDAKVRPVLAGRTCEGEKRASCLSAAQVEAIERIHAGPRNEAGRALYSDWPWDPGIASPGWRMWMMGSEDGRVPALHVALGGSSLAAVFTTPPTAVPSDLQSSADFQMTFDLNRDARKVEATDATFKTSSWQDISARSSDLQRFAAAGGKMIVWHGVSDPVFSINDTIAWYREVDRAMRGGAAKVVRLFPVPGMTHCGGGPATEQFDDFQALVDWVEHGRPPDRILATAGPGAPWPRRTRPLCAYPETARYRGSGDIESADNFVCSRP
jgi:feruloyl esterase